MAYSEFQADRIRFRLRQNVTVEKRMMGGLIFMVNGAMCLGIDYDKKENEDRLMVRVGKLNYIALLGQRGSGPMDFTGKVLNGFLFVRADGFDTDADLDFWVKMALEFNSLLSNPR